MLDKRYVYMVYEYYSIRLLRILFWRWTETKGAVCICLFVSFCCCFTLQNKSIAEHLVPSCQCHVWSLKQAEEVCLDLHDHGNHTSSSHQCSSSITPFFFIRILFSRARLNILIFPPILGCKYSCIILSNSLWHFRFRIY